MIRPRNLYDNAVPSGIAAAIDWLLRLGLFFDESRYEALAVKALRPLADVMGRYPSGFGRYLGALDFHLGPTAEIAVVWPSSAPVSSADSLLEVAFGRYPPNKVVAGAAEGAAASAGFPLLAGRRAVEASPPPISVADTSARRR